MKLIKMLAAALSATLALTQPVFADSEDKPGEHILFEGSATAEFRQWGDDWKEAVDIGEDKFDTSEFDKPFTIRVEYDGGGSTDPDEELGYYKGMALFNRERGEIVFPELVKALTGTAPLPADADTGTEESLSEEAAASTAEEDVSLDEKAASSASSTDSKPDKSAGVYIVIAAAAATVIAGFAIVLRKKRKNF